MYLPYSGWNTGGMTLRGRKVGGKGGKVVTSAAGGVEMKMMRSQDKVQTHEAPVFVSMLFVRVCNFARTVVWQRESTASLESGSSCTTIYSTYGGRE
jgi:hypothetical protein